MICLGNYAVEWGDMVPKIKVRGVIPCVANIFSREGVGEPTTYEPSDCKATLTLNKFALFYPLLDGDN